MKKTMTLYIELLRTLLSPGITFGVVFGLLSGALTNWRFGLISGILSGLLLWLGVSGILVLLSIIQKPSRRGSTGSEELEPDASSK